MLIVFLYYTLIKEPFAQIGLNNLETLSLITSMISIYCGIFYISDISNLDTTKFTFPLTGTNCNSLIYSSRKII